MFARLKKGCALRLLQELDTCLDNIASWVQRERLILRRRLNRALKRSFHHRSFEVDAPPKIWWRQLVVLAEIAQSQESMFERRARQGVIMTVAIQAHQGHLEHTM